MSLSSLASSTYSYLTGSTAVATKEPESLPQTKKWEETKDTQRFIQEGILSDQTIELGDDENESVDTQSLYSSSRRSSIDSNASHIRPVTSRRQPNQLYRLSTPIYRSSSFIQQQSHSEHLLWGFAQVVGQFVSDPKMLDPSKFALLKSKTMYHPFGGVSTVGRGGGGMLMKKFESSYNKRESQSTPVFSTPPSILFVDLNLSPGETVKYSYKLKLPKTIPPSYRGKSIRFNYYLVIGSQRSAPSFSAAKKSVGAQQGHVVQIPFRVLNHVSEDGSRPIYDLMCPEINYTDQAIITTIPMKSSSCCSSIDGASSQKNPISTKSASDNKKCRQEFKEYIEGLLEKTAAKTSIDEIMQKQNDLYEHDEEEKQDKIYSKSCQQTISRITNTSKQATFDICKNNQRVAQLHLIKTLFRLGEPIQGIIDFEGAVIPTVQISIYLESHEVVDEFIALRQPQYIARVSRKRHAGHHAFSVPTGESPEFQTSAMKLQYYLKIELITTGASNANEPTFQDKFHQYHHAASQIDASHFDCQIPVHLLGCSNGSYSTIFGGPHTFALQ
ncbi:hypothetical protein MUCCIDRAFT_109804 [Mucor lusitanicus CBS 277.49]|uniref:Rgp1-domain-containing protein n=1 Tax=Mucor lusitanicus CBS 277.49 TaxID=747725 RepID=A0A168KZC5_MUCCL|nr:hypothetical protein MUCCIDRAFT_109804 [Mucor lusitanicus CBS 277.49]